jgi:hypothetical protein
MTKSIKGTPKKKRGRPPTTGRGTQIGMRWHSWELSAIDHWQKMHNVATRPEAIRRLVELGFASGRRPPAQLSAKNATKAKDLAAKAIDRLEDSAAPAEERASRKRRLLKGPEEFRKVRVDRAKAKHE